MLSYIFIFIVFVHGLIHLLGFIKEWDIMPVSQLSGKTIMPLSEGISRILGILWLLSGLALVILCVFFLLEKDWWVDMALISMIISQLLIVLYWQDARGGTIPNIIILLAIVLFFNQRHFEKKVQDEVQNLLVYNGGGSNSSVTKEMIEALPDPVQKWLVNAGVVGKNNIRRVYLEQDGQIRSEEGGEWMRVDAQQVFTTWAPGFVWNVRSKPGVTFPVAGRDIYQGGNGHMLIKIFSLIPIVSEKGKEINQGAMLRYLAEMVWFPTMVLSQYISWEAIDGYSARATFSYKGISVSGIFMFDEDGNVSGFKAQRYYYRQNGNYSLETWLISMSNYQEPAGIRIPMTGEATWKLENGDFTYYKMELTEIEYDKPFSFF